MALRRLAETTPKREQTASAVSPAAGAGGGNGTIGRVHPLVPAMKLIARDDSTECAPPPAIPAASPQPRRLLQDPMDALAGFGAAVRAILHAGAKP